MMFLSSDEEHLDSSKPDAIKLIVAKEQALRLTQELFLEGRQINSLYIRTREELIIAEKRRSAWVASASGLFGKIVSGVAVTGSFGNIAPGALKESDTVEALSEQFHNELNQRLERLRMIRTIIENADELASGDTATATPSIELLPEGESAPAPAAEVQSPARQPASINKTKILLLLCSRNGTARQALCRFASKMDLHFEIIDYNPEQPATIVEQLYHHRDAQFAIIYWGEPSGRELPGSAHPERYVGFALGFALGRLGRGRVFIMGSTATAPLPGFARILSSQLDSGGGWQIQLARRMKSAGVDIDLNQLA